MREREVEVMGLFVKQIGELLSRDAMKRKDDSPFKTADETRLDELQLLRKAVCREDDLFSSNVQAVESVEKLFLRGALTGKAVDIVDKKSVNGAPEPSEGRHLPSTDGPDNVFCK